MNPALLVPTVLGGSAPFYPGATFAADFKTRGLYRLGSRLTRDITTLSGYSYTRSGSKYELGPSGIALPFDANAPGIVPGVGYFARQAWTNLVTNSAEAGSTGTGSSLDLNVLTAPDGTLTGDKFTEDTGTSTHTRNSNSASASWVSGTTYALSAFILDGTATMGQLTAQSTAFSTTTWCNFDFTGSGAIGSKGANVSNEFIRRVSGGWLVGYTAPATATAASQLFFSFINSLSAGRSPSYTGTGLTSGSWVWSGVAASHFPPVIVTPNGSSAATGADILAFTGLTLPSSYTLVAWTDMTSINSVTRNLFGVSDGTNNNRITIYRSSGNAGEVLRTIGGAQSTVDSFAGKTGARTLKMAARVRSGTMRIACDNVLGAETAISIPAGMTVANFGVNPAAANPLNSPLTFAAILGDTTDEQLRMLTV